MQQNDILPDVQYMDMHYDRFYLVPWPDYQKFEELDEESVYVIPAYVDGQPVCCVDARWAGNDYNDENDA